VPSIGPTRAAAAGVLSLRIAYGAALLVAPTKLAGNRWLGPGAGAAAARVPLRGVGGREIAVHGAGLATLLRGGDARPWLAVSIAGDLADIAATVASRDGLPDGSAAATAAVAGGSALLSAAVALLLED
jgi:hypothetical protein